MLKVQVKNESARVVFVRGNKAGLPSSQRVPAGGAFDFTVTEISAGRLYLSFDKALSSAEPDGANTADADYLTRFDKIELTYTSAGGGAGKANLTAVDFYAIPLMLQTFIHGADLVEVPVEQFSLKAGGTGDLLTRSLQQIATDKATVKNGAEVVRVLSAVKAPGAYPSMEPYVDDVTGAGKPVTIKGTFYGSPARDYAYTGAINSQNILLTMPNENSVTIPADTLKDAVYTCDGVYYLNGDMSTPHHVVDNDFNAAVYRDVVSAFNFGYIGGNYGNSSDGWWGERPFAAANKYYNKYAAAIFAGYPGAYGFPFSDREQIVLADVGGHVDSIRITVLADTAAPAFLPVPGHVNPTSGTVSFNLVPVFANDIMNKTFTVGGNTCTAGWINDYHKGKQTTQLSDGKAAQVLNCPAGEGWNQYEFQIGAEKYLVIVKVTGGKVELATVSGGGNANWTSPNLFIGGLQTYG